MDRRRFLTLIGSAIAGIAVDEAIPLGRVWSFSKNIVIPEINIGSLTPIRVPQRFEIGDIITIGDWPGRFVISRIHPDETVELWSAEQRLLRRGVQAAKLTEAFPQDSSHKPN